MKNTFFLTAAMLVLSLSWLGCNKSGKLNTPSEFKPPTGPMEFKLKWPQGERVEQSLDAKIKSETDFPGQPMPMKQDMTMGMGYGMTVLQANADGTHEIEMEFLSARMGAKMGEKTTMEYDSTKAAAAGKPNPMGDMFGKIIGSKIQYFLDASNAVDRIEGVDEMMNRMASGGKAQAAMPLKSMFNEGVFKQMMNANLYLPPKPVQPGDTWPVQMEFPMPMMGTMVINYDFTFKNWELHGKRNCARLEFEGTIQTKPDAEAKQAGFSMSMQNGSTSGVSWFDPELGITIDTSMNQSFTMIVQMAQNGRANAKAGARMQSITNVMNQDMTIKLVSVK